MSEANGHLPRQPELTDADRAELAGRLLALTVFGFLTQTFQILREAAAQSGGAAPPGPK